MNSEEKDIIYVDRLLNQTKSDSTIMGSGIA
jgi:hypothetical protein